VSIPLPGAGFVYSLVKDVGRWSLSRLQGRHVLRIDGFRRWTVDQWCVPWTALYLFADQDLVEESKAAAEDANRMWEEANRMWEVLPSGAGMTPEEYGSAKALADKAKALADKAKALADKALVRADTLRALAWEELEKQLANGEPIARGFREPLSHGAPYLTISRHEWMVIKLEPPDRAAGGGIAYVGLMIGKPGTKRLFL
jgi:hypothetical protein